MAWKRADRAGRRRIVAEPLLVLRELSSMTAEPADDTDPLHKDLTMLAAIALRAGRHVRDGGLFTARLTKAWSAASEAFAALGATTEEMKSLPAVGVVQLVAAPPPTSIDDSSWERRYLRPCSLADGRWRVATMDRTRTPWFRRRPGRGRGSAVIPTPYDKGVKTRLTTKTPSKMTAPELRRGAASWCSDRRLWAEWRPHATPAVSAAPLTPTARSSRLARSLPA
jgi:hypothetical protein